MSGLFRGLSSIANFARGTYVSTRWRDAATYCSDFPKTTIDFAGKRITVNNNYVQQFNQLDFWIKLNNLERYITRVDSFACRVINENSSTWSYHSFGQAIDINPVDFPASSTQHYALPQWYNTLLNLARQCGFRVGADWQNYYDPMHIEIGARLR